MIIIDLYIIICLTILILSYCYEYNSVTYINNYKKPSKPKLKDFINKKEVYDEIIYDLSINLKNINFYAINLAQNDKIDPFHSNHVKNVYKLDKNLTDFYAFYIIPPNYNIKKQLKTSNSFEYILPQARLSGEVRDYVAYNATYFSYNWPYSIDHPVQDIGKCLDYTYFGCQGPYWPSYEVNDYNYTLTDVGSAKNSFGLKTSADYEIIYENNTSAVKNIMEANKLLNFQSKKLLEIHLKYSKSQKRHVTTFYTKKNLYSRGNYLIHGSKAFVHPHGYVYFGDEKFYIGLDGCETRWNRIKDEVKIINKNFKNRNYTFNDLFLYYNNDKYYNKNLLKDFNMKYFLDSNNLNTDVSSLFYSNATLFYSQFLFSNFYEKSIEFFNFNKELPYRFVMKNDNYNSNSFPDAPIFKSSVKADGFFRVNKVFLITTPWDFNYHHLISDSLSRLVYYYDYLMKNKDVKIHIRYGTYSLSYSASSERQLRYAMFSLFNIDPNRIVFGSVLANEVFIPRTPRCSMSISNQYEIKLLSRLMLKLAIKYLLNNPQYITNIYGMNNINDFNDYLKYYYYINNFYDRKDNNYALSQNNMRENNLFYNTYSDKYFEQLFLNNSSSSSSNNNNNNLPSKILTKEFLLKNNSYYENYHNKNFLIIQQRYSNESTYRTWDDQLFNNITTYLEYKMNSFNDYNDNLMGYNIVINLSSKKNSCLACDIIEYSRASLIFGAHGAGLTNLMFLKRNSLVVEISGRFENVLLPTCGYYHNFGKIFGHSHMLYTHNFPREEINYKYVINEANLFYKAIKSKSNYLIYKNFENEDYDENNKSNKNDKDKNEINIDEISNKIKLITDSKNIENNTISIKNELSKIYNENYNNNDISEDMVEDLRELKIELLRKNIIENEIKKNIIENDPYFYINLFTWYKISNVTYFSSKSLEKK